MAPDNDDETRESDVDALLLYDTAAHTEPETGEEFAAEPDAEPRDDEPSIPLISATNPPGTVTVSAYLNGTVQQIRLSAAVGAVTESELADEIRVVADVAAKKATSAMHIFGIELLAAQGVDRSSAETLMTEHMPFATPAQARAAESALAARHRPADQ